MITPLKQPQGNEAIPRLHKTRAALRRCSSVLSAMVLFCALLTAPAAIAQSKAAEQDPEIHVKIGMQKVLDIPGIKRVAVGSDAIVRANPLHDNELLIRGVSPGRTSLLVWSASGRRQSFVVVVDASK